MKKSCKTDKITRIHEEFVKLGRKHHVSFVLIGNDFDSSALCDRNHVAQFIYVSEAMREVYKKQKMDAISLKKPEENTLKKLQSYIQ